MHVKSIKNYKRETFKKYKVKLTNNYRNGINVIVTENKGKLLHIK
jgi:hypothetical protein